MCFWNINGRTYFLKSDIIHRWLKTNFNVIFISETHFTKGVKFMLEDFNEFHNPYSEHDDNHPRGGISCFIKNNLISMVSDVNKRIPGNIIVELVGGHRIFGSYIPPVDSPYCDETDFSEIANVFTPVNSSHVIIGGGDLNARVGNIMQKLPFDNCKYRQNVDITVNDYGRTLKKICVSVKCYVINNLNIGTKILDGGFTFEKGNRMSQNDLLLANEKGLIAIKNFKIHDIVANPSDHKPISTEFEINTFDDCIAVYASHDILSDQSISNIHRKPKRIKDKFIDWNSYSTIIENDFDNYAEHFENLEQEKSLVNVDTAVDALTKSLYNAAITLTPRKLASHGINPESSQLLHRAELQVSFETWDSLRRDVVAFLKNDITDKERNSWSELMKEKDSKAIWNKISWKGTIGHPPESNRPTLNELSEHFQKKGESGDERSTLLSDITGSQRVDILDAEISLEEIEIARQSLKEERATSDGWSKKMLTHIPRCVMNAILIILNTLFIFHIYPTKWRTTTVNEIFKNKGETRNAKYYRPISLVHLLAKLFDIILKNRFIKWFKPSDAQTAYQPGKSTADHVFLLRCLIQQAKRQKQTLYIIAADFDGAFDRISRSVLVRKLILFGAGTVFVSCLASIYLSTDNIIFRGHEHVVYSLYAGIKQGLPLSPYLFIFYIDDIFTLFDRTYGIVKENIYKIIHLLIHADDVTIIATSRENAISKLRTLLDYCKNNYIVPQVDKCEFLVINGNNDIDKVPLPFGDSSLKHVTNISLLGSHISSSGDLADDLDLHMKKRFSSCVKFFNFCRENKLAPVGIKIKVLKACVVNSLLYNCETFGNKVPDGIVTLYHKLIRCALNVRTNTPTLLLYIEAGLLPIKALIETRQYNFFNRFPSTIAELSNRHHLMQGLMSDPSNFLKHYIQLSQRYHNVREIYTFYVNQLKNSIRDSATKGKYRYQMYLQINPELTQSPFMSCLHPMAVDIIRFRLGSHKLPIEIGRWNRVSRNLRFCHFCNTLGDEQHYIYSCPLIRRDDLHLSKNISEIWSQEGVLELIRRIKEADLI